MENLNKLTRLLGADRIMTAEDVQQILLGIMEILKSYKEGTESINEETKQVVNSLLEHTVKYNQETISDFKSEAEKAHAERMKELQTFLSEVKTTLGDMEVMMGEVKDGKDADEERVVEEVINRIKIDPTVVTMSAEEVRDKIASLKDEDRLDKSAIKGLEKVLQQKDLDYAVATLQHQASFLINKGGLKTVSHDATLSGDGTPESPLRVESTSGLTLETDGTPNGSQTLLNLVAGTNVTLTDNGTGSVTIDATGGSGSPGGSTTQLQYNNAGAFGGISGATTNGTAVTYTTGNLIGADVKASGSGGLALKSNNGTTTSLHGAGGGANNTFYGDVKLDYATATTVPYIDASKNLISSSVTPTELGYLSGVTSAIQTQLNAKGAGTVTSVSSANGALSVATGTTTPVLTVNSAPILTTARTIGTITGDATSAGSSFDGSANNTNALTLATVNSNVGSFGSATASPAITVNAKGLVTAVSTNTITPAVGSITGLGTGVGTFLATPSSANLATAVTDETGSGSLVFGTSPTLATPVIDGATLNGDLQVDGTPNTDDTWNGKSTNSFNAGATIAQFDCVYMSSSSTWLLTDADAIGTAGNVLVMMAGAAGTASNPLRVIEPGSWVRNDAWNWTVGGTLYLDTATPGGMTQTAPSGADDVVKVVGYAVSADVIYFAPSVNWIIHT